MSDEWRWSPSQPSARGVDFDAVVEAAPGELSEEELRQLLVQADRVRARLDAAVAGLAGAFDGRAAWAADGARGPAPWLAARTQTSASSWRGELRLARALRDMPLVEAAAREGRLSRDKVKALVWARQPDLADVFAWCEEQLVREVEAPTVAGAWRYVRRWVLSMRELMERNEPDGAEPTDGEGRSKVVLSPALEGRWFGSLDLSPEDGEIVATAVDLQIQALWDRQVFRADDDLTVPERRAIAFVEVLRRGTRGGAEDSTARPLVLGIVSLSDLGCRSRRREVADEVEDGAGSAGRPPAGDGPFDASSRAPADLADPGEMAMPFAELSRSGPVDLEVLRRLACEGDVAPVIIGEDGVPLAMGRHIRLANRHQRRALRVRDGYCAFAGCSVPASQCIVHHLTAWEDGGPTDLVNLCLLCRFHHRSVHEGRFRIGWDRGVLVTFRPDGTPILDTRPDWPGPLHRHRLPLPEGISPAPRHRSATRREVEASDPDALHLHHLARTRIDALIAEARTRRHAVSARTLAPMSPRKPP
ncbi:MAG TPA: DUF222 domain-containing protein [Acidimicrobiales bacterium]|nr:DUF222 domain-containing protein [Acidimicrobiales bacterium]